MEMSIEKCGIRINPPAFVITYRKSEKLRKKVMPLRNFTSSSDVEAIATDLKERQNLERVPVAKIKKMLRLLQEVMNGEKISDAAEKIQKQFELKINEDLNKLSTEELEFQKQLMESVFLKNQIKTDDSNFVYDKRLDFTEEKTQSNWDLETDDNFWS